MQGFKSDDLLSLLVHLIVVDHKIYPEEIEAFVKAGLSLRLLSDNGTALSRRDLIQWFEKKYKSINEAATTKEVHQDLVALFQRLEEVPNKQDVLDWMCVIAMSDGPVHMNERLIVALAAGHWDLHPPVWDELRSSKTG